MCVCICTYVKCSSNAGLSHPPSILCIGGLMSRSCMCWKVEAWKRRMVGSYLMDTHTPSPTPIICVISLFFRGCTMKAAYNMNRIEICMYCTINMHEGWCSPTIPLLSHKHCHYPQLSGHASQMYVLCHIWYQTQYYGHTVYQEPRVSTIGTAQVPKQTVLIHLLAPYTPTLQPFIHSPPS